MRSGCLMSLAESAGQTGQGSPREPVILAPASAHPPSAMFRRGVGNAVTALHS